MRIDLVHILKNSPLFSSLDENDIKSIISEFKKVYVHKNKILFHQGEFSNSIYIVITGKLVAMVKSDKQIIKIIGEIHTGESVGELAALSSEPRTATVKAIDNSILLKLSRESFNKICQQYHSVLQHTVDAVIDRSRQILHLLAADGAIQKHIAIIPATEKVDLTKFNQKIYEHVHNNPEVMILSDYDVKFRETHHTSRSLQQCLKDIDKKVRTIIFMLSSINTPLAIQCFHKIDTIYIVADSADEPYISQSIFVALRTLETVEHINPELILLHESDTELPQNTARWLKLAHFRLYHHIRINQEKDIAKILRFIEGKAIGLVLGGGGVRSWAHFGVIKALKEAKIPIDIIGGTSAGAIVAGYYALHENFDGIPIELKELTQITRKSVAWQHFTWPAVSLFDGKAYTQKQKEIFGKARIENLWLSCFSVACNLATNSQVIGRKGYLWKTIRSSTAVPAIFPPVVINGKIHLDGGILNNLPVDIMRKLLNGSGTIIASELTHYNNDMNEYFFPPILTLGKVFLAKSKILYKDYKFPPFIETFLKALLAGSSAKQNENCLAADILVAPDLSQYSLLSVSPEEEDELIKLGYKSTVKAIRKWKKK